jgi:hypothetical protein
MNRYDDKPDIMAIGDSMYQGIRSLSFLPSMVEHSVPKQVANALSMSMVMPDLARPLLFDLEQQIREGGLLHLVKRIREDCLANLKFWQFGTPWSEHEAFDNIAVGGAEIGSLLEDTYALYHDKVTTLSTTLANPNLPLEQLAGTIGELWYALNNCYMLNPRQRDQQAGKSPMQQVADRQPRILLINIGSNEGLFRAGFLGDFSSATLQRVATIPNLLKPLAQALRELPDRVERIVFNSLIRPRFIPNMMPSPEHQNDFPGDDYYFMYGPRLTDTQTPISNQMMRDFDRLIAQVNAESQDVLRSALGSRIVFADIYNASLQFDGKHYQDRGLAIPGHHRKLTNQAIQPVPGGFLGGFASLDNMHPTIPGYATIADVVLAALGRANLQTDKAAAFAADTLLNHLPGLAVFVADAELALIGGLGIFRGRGLSAPVQSPLVV